MHRGREASVLLHMRERGGGEGRGGGGIRQTPGRAHKVRKVRCGREASGLLSSEYKTVKARFWHIQESQGQIMALAFR